MLGRIKKDKWKHFAVGIAIGLFFQGFALHYFQDSAWMASLVVFMSIALICYGFEVASLVFKRGHYDFLDAVAGIVGGVLGMAILLLFR